MRKFLKRAAIVVFALAALVAVGLIVLAICGGRELDRQIAAWTADGGPRSLTEMTAEPVLPAANAAVVYQRAFDAMPEWTGEQYDLLGEPWDHEGLADLADPCAAVVDALREGAVRARCAWPTNYADGFATLLPHVAKAMQAAKLLRVDAIVRAGRGDADGAVRDIEAGLALGDAVRQDPFLVSLLVDVVIEETMLETYERLFRDAPAPASRVGEILVSRDWWGSLRRALYAEGGCVLMEFDRGTLEGQVDLLGTVDAPGRWLYALPVTKGWRRYDIAYYLRSLRGYVEQLDRPYPEQRIEFDTEDIPHWAILSNLVMPALAKCGERIARMEARGLLAQAAIGLREGGAYPETFEGPADPFDGRPIRYRRDGDGFVLWSVGPDGVDSEGDPEQDIVWRWER